MAGTAVVLGFEHYQELHVWYPVLRLREEGGSVLVACADGVAAAFGTLGYPLAPQVAVSEIDVAEVGLVVIPGGTGAAAAAREGSVIRFVQACAASGAMLAAIAEGVEVLTAAGIAVPALAGATTTDGPVVVAADADALPELFRVLTSANSLRKVQV